ncbi:MAG: AIR synthase-related protein [Spirosomataceae bacterium]
MEQQDVHTFQLDTVQDVIEVDEIGEVAKHILTHLSVSESFNSLGFDSVGDLIYLIGQSKNDILSSLYLHSYRGIGTAKAPVESGKLASTVMDLINQELIASANSVGEGGLFVALVRASIFNTLGFSIKTDPSFRKDAFLFGESSERVVVSVKSDNQLDFEEALSAQHIPAKFLGVVSKGKMAIDSEKIMDVTEAKTLLGV